MTRQSLGLIASLLLMPAAMPATERFVTFQPQTGAVPVIAAGCPVSISVLASCDEGIRMAADRLRGDMDAVAGTARQSVLEQGGKGIVVGLCDSPEFEQMGLRLDSLRGHREQFVVTTVDGSVVIAGSDKRGAIYGIYELSRQMGVSPWYWWADVPVARHSDVYVCPGVYSDGQPAVAYRGIFLNDEAPCLTSWVKNRFGTGYGGHEFYEKVFELILRLRGNFLWPAMWGWAFYADDPENGKLADRMGVVIGTSHHEPMARNHQEWARHRKEYGAWNYHTNQKVLDTFFTDGIKRMNGTEDVVTIGMRGDGDEAMSEDADVKLLERIIKNQRDIIKKVTKRPAKETPQVWALYKEVLDYYDKGLKVPDDVILLLCDDNWGNVRRLPNAEERKHPGGWGMYYHVDYVGAPRNSKWLNMTPIQGMWEQLGLTYEYGVDKLWVLNVGDLKPMEYPITLFLDMAWNPSRVTLPSHAEQFCGQQFGAGQAAEAARILNLYCKYAGRVTAEMLDARTYNVETGEWRQVRDEWMALEAEALRQYTALPAEAHDAYRQLILFPVQAMANLYDMYYAQAMNHHLYKMGDAACNDWAARVQTAFKRDSALCLAYNKEMAGGKWDGMMTQKHIGYTSWDDRFPHDMLPKTFTIDSPADGGWVFECENGVVSIEAEHYFEAKDSEEAKWTVIAGMGRTLSGITLMPRRATTEGASLTYKMQLPKGTKEVEVRVIVKSTLAFQNKAGHTYTVAMDGGEAVTVNYNHNLNEEKQNIYSVFYPTVARRVVENKVKLAVKEPADGLHTLTLTPVEPGTVFEKIVVDLGGYKPSYLFMNESKRMHISFLGV